MHASRLHLSHFPAMVIFALLVSIGLAALGSHSTAQRIKYALWSFVLFLAIGVGLAWLMYPFSR
ncbi:MAG: hypothetical protein WA581_01285 [Candidatus Acidiferrales bacterium]